MARIERYEDLPLDCLEIGMSQVRTKVGARIDELAASIKKIGLLQPIVVCPTARPGKYEILLGQRRYLAHRELQLPTIKCAIFDEPVDPIMAKVISLSENLIREALDQRDKIDVCTHLYKHYGGSLKAVAEKTGLPYSEVRNYVKYDRLLPQVKKLVDEAEVDLKVALKAQDAVAATSAGDPDPDEVVKLAMEMRTMTGVNRERLVKEVERQAGKPISEVVEKVKTGGTVVQVVVTLGENVHKSLQEFASKEGTSQDDAAASLIYESLKEKGFLEDDE